MPCWYAVERTSYSTLLFIYIWGMAAWNRTARIGEPPSMNMTFSCSKSKLAKRLKFCIYQQICLTAIFWTLTVRICSSSCFFFFFSNIGFYHWIKFIITLLSLRSEIFYLFFFHAVEFIGSRISCYLQLVQLGWLWLQLEECCLGKLSGILCPCWSWTHIEKSLLLQGVLGVLWLLGIHLIPVTLVIR